MRKEGSLALPGMAERNATLRSPAAGRASHALDNGKKRLCAGREARGEVLRNGEANPAVIDARDVVAQRHEEQNNKPEDSGNDDELRAAGHKLSVHKE